MTTHHEPTPAERTADAAERTAGYVRVLYWLIVGPLIAGAVLMLVGIVAAIVTGSSDVW